MLEYVDAHRTSYILRQLLWLSPSFFLMVVFLALAIALRRHGQSLAAIAALIAVTSWAVSFVWPTTGDGSLTMVVLSDRYADAATASERAPFVAGAEILDALNDVPAVIGVLQTLGLLLMALLMLRGPSRSGWPGWVSGRAWSGSSPRSSGRFSAGVTRRTGCCCSPGSPGSPPRCGDWQLPLICAALGEGPGPSLRRTLAIRRHVDADHSDAVRGLHRGDELSSTIWVLRH